ncbi:uncharacterized protein LOC110722264 [Chenopodium quinoa]|uniref:uncharacterized protein LOC110722264 n=1 Tax=Chenopodium quinoa TaxID=63459 RepID=UPI000B780723|nr:uncharacterized protein LOC110722264 [Chenopodium quinoa]
MEDVIVENPPPMYQLKDNLRKRGINVDYICAVCNSAEETDEHLFRDCPIIQRVWACGPLGIQVGETTPPLQTWTHNLLRYLLMQSSYQGCVFMAVLWAIWLHRNEVTFGRATSNPCRVIALLNESTSRLKDATIHPRTQGACYGDSPPHVSIGCI